MELKEKVKKIKLIANTISPYNYFSLGYLDIFYLAYYKEYIYCNMNQVRQYWLDYLKKNSPVYLNFYIHIPFCEVGCTYCKYFKDTNPTEEKVDKFLDYLETYFEYFNEVFKAVRIVNLHIGGGTPSLLTIKQLDRMFKFINKYCNFETPNEIAFEINPKSINKEKIQVLKDYKVNRLAIGIQSLNKEVLKTVDRDHYDFEHVKNMMADIKSLGFAKTTLDLLFGLYKDTPFSFMDTLKKTLSLRPDRIHIYVVNPPREYLEKYFNNDYNKFFKRINQLQKVVFPMIKQLMKNQTLYRCEDLSFKKKDYDITKIYYEEEEKPVVRRFGYSDTVEDDVAMLGIGKNSRSHLNNLIIYKDKNDDHLNFNSEKKIFYGHTFTEEDFILKKFFEKLIKEQLVDLNKFNKDFDIDFIEKHQTTINFLLAEDLIIINENILKQNFKNSLERFTGAMLFLDDKIINNIYQNCLDNTYE